MSIEVWMAFAIAATILVVIPGPTIILVISQAIAYGRRAVVPLVCGVVLGDFTAMSLSLVGLGAILAASARFFFVLKWIGAIYLIYLGIKHWRSHSEGGKISFATAASSNRALFKSAYVVTALNPKGIVFFVAFLPQFISPSGHAAPQF